jgi:hypothetical protein
VRCEFGLIGSEQDFPYLLLMQVRNPWLYKGWAFTAPWNGLVVFPTVKLMLESRAVELVREISSESLCWNQGQLN